MAPTLSPHDFVNKWRGVTGTERATSQSHFIDVCALVGHPTPTEHDPHGVTFAFEAGVEKVGGGQGFADVWKKGYFAWEYKGPHGNLERAYQQLLQYHEALENPPLLIVSDMQTIVIHTKFTNTAKKEYTLTLDDLLKPEKLQIMHDAFWNPDALRAAQTTKEVTEQAAKEFARLAEMLRQWGAQAHPAAHFLIRLLFCLFAEDIGLLPNHIFTRLIEKTRQQPALFATQVQQLFGAMATGGFFGLETIPHFDGGLFNDDTVLELHREDLGVLWNACDLDWASVDPSILGTLFERSLDPSKRSQIGAHYTSREDMELIVEPVLMAPLRRRWSDVQAQARTLAKRANEVKATAVRNRLVDEAGKLLRSFAGEIAHTTVLDPACGSGNFLYVALQMLHDLEKEVSTLSGELGIGMFQPSVAPGQLYGIEVLPYAHELAQATVWIGHLQWMRDNGYGESEPILRPLSNIVEMDAILSHDANGNPVEPEWPAVDVIVGNPPFLGGNKIRQELSDGYVNALFALYGGRLPALADLVCYWFEKARAMIEVGTVKRVGLLATQGIRGGANRDVLKRIKRTGDIFWAQSDREWVLEGANVHVSMVGFDNGDEKERMLDGQSVDIINSDLSAKLDLTIAMRLTENVGICFRSDEKGGPFDISQDIAQGMLSAPINVNGRPNSDVVRPYFNALDITRRPQHVWIIDFGCETPEHEAAMYEQPFEYVRRFVKPFREKVRSEREKRLWWLHRRPAPDMREAVKGVSRFMVTPSLSKYRAFAWLDGTSIPDHQLVVFARDDDYFFGVLHSRVHEVWALKKGTALEDRPRYTPTSTFETFPFPWPPGKEPSDDARVKAIAEAAKSLVEQRDAWFNPPGASAAELKKRTLTKLYNERPTWLEMAHKRLDEAVLDAYGWSAELSDEEILARLLKLNLERAGKG
jgi:type II restriction/modification system DNA methylase subunit YeeA